MYEHIEDNEVVGRFVGGSRFAELINLEPDAEELEVTDNPAVVLFSIVLMLRLSSLLVS